MTRRSWPDWLRTQSHAFQDRALGKRRAQAFRDGTLTIATYSDPPGRMTLDDLVRTRPEATDAEVNSDDEETNEP